MKIIVGPLLQGNPQERVHHAITGEKPKRNILTPGEVAKLLDHARGDKERGVFYAFPFLTGVRVSEQLGLLWNKVDLDRNVICIRRVQERDGIATEHTKTDAGEREIPISPTLRTMLLEWRLICPRLPCGS